MTIVLFALAGFLAGGAFTVARNGGTKVVLVVLIMLAALAAVAGTLWAL